jgi:hypothetical protein
VSSAGEVLIELEARHGPRSIGPHYEPLQSFMYNGSAPGPLIEARVGNTLVVRLTNMLPGPTSFALSGQPVTRGRCESPIVQPHETRDCRFTLMNTGTFWYHPAGYVTQVERGLHGVLVVRAAAHVPTRAERIIVLDDACIGRRAVSHRNADEACPGNVLLMNGSVQPQLMVPAATVEHWRVVNVAPGRRIHFSLGGASFRRTDHAAPEPASARRPHLRRVTQTILEPGHTADLTVGPFEAGTRLHVQSAPQGAPPASRGLAAVFGTVLVGK